MSDSRPNIILLMTDQHRFDALGIHNPVIKTPNLDRLAREGISFREATCQAPMCVPSRNSMMFGLYPSQLGVRTNGDGLFDEERLPRPPLPELLRRAGYQTAGFGKTHWYNGRHPVPPSTRGFEVRRAACVREEGALMMSDDDPEGFAAYHEETKDFGGGEENPRGYIGCTSRVPAHQHRDGWVAEQCLKFLDEGVDPNRPLFLYLSFLKPHAGLNVPREFEELYDLSEIPDIPQPPWSEEPDTHVCAAEAASPTLRRRYEAWRSVWQELSPLQRRQTTLRYWANCSWLDAYFGQVLERLKAMGRLENALILFLSDHGELLGERNFRFSKYCLYESSVRVPLILAGSVIPPEMRGSVDDRPAELVDILPTVANAAGIPLEGEVPGLDLLGERRRAGAFCEFHAGGAPAYMWRKKDWKLILFLPGKLEDALARVGEVRGELYNLEADPHEWTNLYDDEAYRHVREAMKTELLMHLACAWTHGPFAN